MRRLLALAVILAWCAIGGGVGRAADQAAAARRTDIYPQLGNSQMIWAIAFSRDGQRLASADPGATKIWDAASGRELRTLKAPASWLAFSPSGDTLYTLDGGKVTTWNATTGERVRSISATGYGNSVDAAALSPDGTRLALGAGDHSVWLWDLTTNKTLSKLGEHAEAVSALAFSPDGGMIASGSRIPFNVDEADNPIRLWDARSGAPLRNLVGNRKQITGIAFSPDGKILASSAPDGVRVWDARRGKLLKTLSTDYAEGVAISPDGRTVVAYLGSGFASAWQLPSGQLLEHWSLNPLGWPTVISDITPVAFSPDGSKVALPRTDAAVVLHDLALKTDIRSFRGHSVSVSAIALAPGETMAAVGESDGNVAIWNLQSAAQTQRWKANAGSVTAIAYLSAGQRIATTGSDGEIKIWAAEDGRLLRQFSEAKDQYSRPMVKNVLAVSPDGSRLATLGPDYYIRLWDAETGAPLQSWLSTGARDLAFTPDGRGLAVAYINFKSTVWDLGTGKAGPEIHGDQPIAYGDNGRWLALGDVHTFPVNGDPIGRAGDAIHLVDAQTGRELKVFQGRGPIAVSADSVLLANTEDDGEGVTVWDVASGARKARLVGHAGQLKALAFTEGGKALLSAAEDGTLRIWDLASGRERAEFLPFSDGSMLAMTPEGFFTATSASAERNLNVRIGDRVLGIASYRQLFYSPELVRRSLAGLPPPSDLPRIPDQKLPPVVAFAQAPPAETSDPTLTLNLRLRDAGGGVGGVRLFLNGSAVHEDDAASAGGSASRNYRIRLAPGPNAISAVAFNADGSVQSDEASVTVTAKLPSAGPVLHAVVVGVNQYRNPEYKLVNAVADAKLFASLLQERARPIFAGVDIKLLVTPADTDKAHVMAAIRAMQSQAGPNDEFVLYFAGHGGLSGGRYYLMPSNVVSDAPERLTADAISSRDIASLLSNVPATRKLLIVDACQSAALGDAMKSALANQGIDVEAAAAILGRGAGLTVLAATATDQEAQDDYGNQGLFTSVLAGALQGRDGRAAKVKVDADGTISTFALADYVEQEVPAVARSANRPPQTPIVSKNGDPFPVARVN